MKEGGKVSGKAFKPNREGRRVVLGLLVEYLKDCSVNRLGGSKGPNERRMMKGLGLSNKKGVVAKQSFVPLTDISYDVRHLKKWGN